MNDSASEILKMKKENDKEPDVSQERLKSIPSSARNAQSAFSIDSILSHKMMTQQYKQLPGNRRDHYSDRLSSPSHKQKFDTDCIDITEYDTNNNVIDRTSVLNSRASNSSNKHSLQTAEKRNEYSCNCPDCIRRKPRDVKSPLNRNDDLSYVNYYRNEYSPTSTFYRVYRPNHTTKEDSIQQKLPYHINTTDDNQNKRRRTIFTASQLERLEYEFQQQQYIVGQDRRYLARELGLNEVQVKVWFQNRRIKWRKYTHGYFNDGMLPESRMYMGAEELN